MREPDVTLLRRAQEGDLAAFADFVRLFERRVRAVLGRLLDDERDVDEAAQDTFVQAWRNLDRFRGDAAPFTWLYRIAVNEALQRARRKQLETRPLDDAVEGDAEAVERASSAPPVDAVAEDREALAFLAERLRALPVEIRIPLVLRDIEGWSHDEIAGALGLSLAASKSRIHRARMQVSKEFQAWLAGERAQEPRG